MSECVGCPFLGCLWTCTSPSSCSNYGIACVDDFSCRGPWTALLPRCRWRRSHLSPCSGLSNLLFGSLRYYAAVCYSVLLGYGQMRGGDASKFERDAHGKSNSAQHGSCRRNNRRATWAEEMLRYIKNKCVHTFIHSYIHTYIHTYKYLFHWTAG